MASTTSAGPALNLFPSPNYSLPRKSSLKKRSPYDNQSAPGELKGVAFQVKSSTEAAPGVIQPANDHIKHALFCEPSSSVKQAASSQGAPKRQNRARRRSSALSSIYSQDSSPLLEDQPEQTVDEDKLSPLPENTHFGPNSSPPRRNPSGRLKKPDMPRIMSTEAQPDEETPPTPSGDKLSPLPDKERFAATSPKRSEYPAPLSLRSGSPAPTLGRSNSTATCAPPYSPPSDPAPARSMFPQYDHSRSLREQQYYPSERSPPPTLPREKISKLKIPVDDRPAPKRADSGIALVNGYEHIPVAERNDLQQIWNASEGKFPVDGRKVQISLLQPRSGTALAIGRSEDEILYSMDKTTHSSSSKSSEKAAEKPNTPKQLSVKKHCPKRPSSDLVARLSLPDQNKPERERQNDVVSIFPQVAAIRAIEAIANTARAASIAEFDPTAASPEAARLAQDAVSDAHAWHRCQLSRATRKRDSLGAVTAMYRLDHRRLGTFAITVTKSTIGRHSRDPRAKISLHHPSATPAAISAETLVLAFLDFASDACVLDTPGLVALEAPYVIDTAICALLTVAVIENDALMLEQVTFAGPPKIATPANTKAAKRVSRANTVDDKRSSGWFSRKNSKKKQKEMEKQQFEAEQVDLPVLTQGALALLGLSFKTAVWVLGASVKVTAGVIIGATHLAQKA